MMKKITRIAALLAATAFLLAGFPACSDDDGDGDPTLTDVEIAVADEAKTEYKVGEEFNKTGITVTATYSNNTTKDVTAEATFAATCDGEPFTTEKKGTFDVTLTATYGGKTAYKTCEITVKDESDDDPTLTAIEVTTENTVKTEYTVGEEFDKTGITVTATYSNNTTKDVTDKATITPTSGDAPFTTATAGTYTVTLTATYEGKTAKTEPCTITVKDETGGEIVENPTVTNIEIAVAATVKTEYDIGEDFDKTGITVTATYSDDSTKDVTTEATFAAICDGEPFTTETAGTFDVTLTATYEGKTASATSTITVKAKGKTYAWNFQTTELSTVLSFVKDSENKDCLDAEGTYEATPAGLTLVLPQGLKFNKLEPTTSGSGGASNGAIQPLAGDNGDIYVEVQGPFTAEMLYASNGGDKADRSAYIKIGEEKKAESEGTLTNAVSRLSYTYDGTDTVKVSFGGTNYIRIYDIKITTENGDDTGKNDGEVKSKAEFVATTDDTTANDEATLGLVGTSATSSAPEVATATIENDKIVITSVSAGSATITVTDGTEGHEATIEVTVSGMGKITMGKITPYVDLASIFTVTDGVLELKAGKSYVYTLNGKNLNDTKKPTAFTDAEWIAIDGAKSDKAIDENGKYGSPASLNTSSSRVLTVKVKGVKTFKLYAANSNTDAGRIASISIDNGTATEYKHDGRSGTAPYDFVTIELNGEEHTLVIKGGTKSIYLTAIELLSE